MAPTVWHCHIAVSLDGKIARPDGSVDWLEKFPPDEFGFDGFYTGIDAILMGRSTYDVIRGMGDWPYPGKPTVVMSNRPIGTAPVGVEARSGDLGTVAAELEGRRYGRVWIEGGGQILRGMVAIGKLDILEMALIPVVLGDGIPLFAPGTAELPLRLVECAAKSGGAVHLVYRRAD